MRIQQQNSMLEFDKMQQSNMLEFVGVHQSHILEFVNMYAQPAEICLTIMYCCTNVGLICDTDVRCV